MPNPPHAAVWFVTATLVLAATIDYRRLKVPNWLTFPFALGGLAFWAAVGGLRGATWSLEGLGVGLALLLAFYAIGGMGAGDVKLFAGVGAWMGPAVAFDATLCWTLVGGTMALVKIARSGNWRHHLTNMYVIGHEIVTIRDPVRLSAIAAERKPTMTLLPYGVPITIGSIGYFAWAGLLF